MYDTYILGILYMYTMYTVYCDPTMYTMYSVYCIRIHAGWPSVPRVSIQYTKCRLWVVLGLNVWCLCLHSLPIQIQMQAHFQFECWCMLAVQQGRVVSLLSDTRVTCNICLHNTIHSCNVQHMPAQMQTKCAHEVEYIHAAPEGDELFARHFYLNV